MLGQEQVNSTTPKAQSVESRYNTVALTDITPKDMLHIPKGSRMLSLTVTGPTADAAATLDVGTKGVNNDLGAAIALDGAEQSVNFGLDTDVGTLTSDVIITATIGGAAPTNGPWIVGINYVRNLFDLK